MESMFQQVLLSDLGDSIGAPPSERLRKSVRTMGVIQPILLAESTDADGEIGYTIIDGNRRVAAARKAKLRQIPAFVLKDLTADQISQLTLTANGFRSANYLTEFWAIKQLGRSDFSTDEIMEISGLSHSSMTTRGRFSRLNRDLFVALRNGKLLQTFASTIAQLPSDDQEALARKLHERGRLLKRDIDAYHQRPPAKPAPAVISIAPTEAPINIQFRQPTVSAEPGEITPDVPSFTDLPPLIDIEELEAPISDTDLISPAWVEDDEALAIARAAARLTPQPSEGVPLIVEVQAIHHAPDTQIDHTVVLHSHLAAAVDAARSLGMNQSAFLDMAYRAWEGARTGFEETLDTSMDVAPAVY